MTSSVTAPIPADPDALFRAITDIEGLARWNRAITSVVETPAELIEGSEWVVELHALGQTWRSRSKLLLLDPAARQLAYRSSTDDGNPSWVDWQWSVDDHSAGAEVTVTWQLHPSRSGGECSSRTSAAASWPASRSPNRPPPSAGTSLPPTHTPDRHPTRQVTIFSTNSPQSKTSQTQGLRTRPGRRPHRHGMVAARRS